MSSAERAIESAVVNLGHLLVNEIKFLNEVHGDVYWMQSELRWMSCFLEDADTKRKQGDKRTKNWIREVTSVAQEAEDVVDTFMLQIERKRRQKSRLFKTHACNPSKLVDLHYIGTAIVQIKSKIHSISESKERYGINSLGESSGSTEEKRQAQRNINSHPHGNKFIVGFRGIEKLILKRLLKSEVKKRVVVPIVGMGGLGKTTLAKMIYNSDAAKDWFKYRACVTVSEEFKPFELLHNIIRQVGGNPEDYKNMDTNELKSELHKCLKGEKYIIVLDDIWEQDVWQELKDAFPDEDGSGVLITTRSIEVGKFADPSNKPYELPFLDDKTSWKLFLNVVFPSEDGSELNCPKVLEPLGKDLVKKCGGLPMGVIMLGGLLSVTEHTIYAWNKVAVKWKYEESSKLWILALSYNHLPNANMKSCFLYIGNYPEDHIIRASEVTKFWIAEGFIPKEVNQTFEETAKDYLDEFVLRCMVQVVDRTKTSKRVKHFRIHDLFRKWCISEAQEDGFFRICTSNTDASDPEIIAARRLTVYESIVDDKFCDLPYKARAILGFDCLSASNFLSKNIGHNFKLLRVIYLNFPKKVKIHKSKLPKDISRLIHLRNITLISEALKFLPSSIGRLHNLQTLNIKNTGILKLPKTIYKIHTLRHLYTRGVSIRSSVIWKSRNLQTLDSISGGSWMLKDFTKLLNLRKLSISRITQNGVSGLQDSLHKLNHLKSLCLESDGQPDPSLFISFKSHNPLSKLVLINWSNVSSKFPQNLISIKLSGCTFEKGVIASLEKLQGLTNFNLEDCGVHPEDEFVYSANGFQQLENLHIGEMRSLLDWRIVNGALPKIKYLIIKASNWLAKLPDGLEHLKSLQKLEMVEFKENLRRRLLETLEDRHKIPQITYVTLNGIQLDQYKRSSEKSKEEPKEEKSKEEPKEEVPKEEKPKEEPMPKKPKEEPKSKPMPRKEEPMPMPPEPMALEPMPPRMPSHMPPKEGPMPMPPEPMALEPIPPRMPPKEGPMAPEPMPPKKGPMPMPPEPIPPKGEPMPMPMPPEEGPMPMPPEPMPPKVEPMPPRMPPKEGPMLMPPEPMPPKEEPMPKKPKEEPKKPKLLPPKRSSSFWVEESKKEESVLSTQKDEPILSTQDYEPVLYTQYDELVLSTEDDEPILSTSDDEPILSLEDESVRGRSKFKMPKARVMVNRKMEAPLGESKCKVMLDVVGHKHCVGRPGVDFVIVLDAGRSNSGIKKLAMKFVLEKLSSDDRVSIISSSLIPMKLCRLRQIKKRSLADIKIMINSNFYHPHSNIAAGIVMALKVLSDRRFTTGRMAAVLLMSDGNLSTLDRNNIPHIKPFNIPIYTFGFGEDCDQRKLRDISNLSVGGTFSYIWNTDDFSIAFSQCFAGLLGVAIPDLKLTVRQINSTIQTVSAGNYTQSMDNAAGSVTINFGDIYVNELCKIIVDLSLPAVGRPRTEYILEITLRAADGLTRFPIYVDVTRNPQLDICSRSQ